MIMRRSDVLCHSPATQKLFGVPSGELGAIIALQHLWDAYESKNLSKVADEGFRSRPAPGGHDDRPSRETIGQVDVLVDVRPEDVLLGTALRAFHPLVTCM